MKSASFSACPVSVVLSRFLILLSSLVAIALVRICLRLCAFSRFIWTL